MRKRLLAVLLTGILGITVFAKSVSLNGMGDLLSTLTKMYSTQMGMDLKMVEDGIKQAQSLQNQAEMIKYEIQNLQKLGQAISEGNISSINSFLNKIEDMKSNSMSILNNQSKLISQYREIYKQNPEAFKDITGYNDASLAALKRQVDNAKNETNYMIYDAVTQAGYSAKLNHDVYNLNSLLQASKTSSGALEVLQVTNNLLGAQQTTLLEIRQLLETNLKMSASIESSNSTINSAQNRIIEENQRQMKEENEKYLKKMDESMNKPIKFGK